MKSYETFATVEEQGRVLVAGVPFAPGTEVEITISPKRRTVDDTSPPDDETLAASRDRMRELFRTIKGSAIHPIYRVRSCMNADIFIDTNILLYTIDEDSASTAKRKRAQRFSEDLNDGQNYDGVTVVNPFTGVTP